MDNEILRIGIEAVLGCTTLLGFILYYKQTKRMKNAEALKAEIEADGDRYEMYEERLNHCNQTVEQHNETIIHQSETIANLNSALDGKTERIRELTDKLWQSETGSNKLNAQLIEKTEIIGQLNLRIDKLMRWKCHDSNCNHRIPQSPTIKGKTFEEDCA